MTPDARLVALEAHGAALEARVAELEAAEKKRKAAGLKSWQMHKGKVSSTSSGVSTAAEIEADARRFGG